MVEAGQVHADVHRFARQGGLGGFGWCDVQGDGFGRLRREATIEHATTELSGITASLAERYPETTITLIEDTTTYTEDNYHRAMETLFEGAALAVSATARAVIRQG